jgi:hypothetical protein
MQINPDGILAAGYMFAAGGLLLGFFAVLEKRKLDKITAELDAAEEAERLKKAP